MIGSSSRGIMLRTSSALLALAFVGCGPCLADEPPPEPTIHKHVRVVHVRSARARVVEEVVAEPVVVLRPNCYERFFLFGPRVMYCAPEVYVPPSKAVQVALEAPPAIRKLPYPSLFPYRYGN